MSWKKTADLCVKTGEYEKDGETKNRYENVGMILSDGNGEMHMLKRTFNPAGVPGDGDMIVLSVFKERDREGQKRASAGRRAPPRDEPDDDIPF